MCTEAHGRSQLKMKDLLRFAQGVLRFVQGALLTQGEGSKSPSAYFIQDAVHLHAQEFFRGRCRWQLDGNSDLLARSGMLRPRHPPRKFNIGAVLGIEPPGVVNEAIVDQS